jgi:RHS repeat-associated protein
MSSDWQAVGLTADPTPGDPEAVRALATQLGLHAQTADGGTTQLRTIATGGGGDLAMRGDYAAGYDEALRDLPDQLAKLAKAYRGAGLALATYATALTEAKTKSGTALRNGVDAQIRYRGALAQVESLLPPDRAVLLWPSDELSPQSIAAATAHLETPGLAGQVQVIARQGQDARFDQTLAARLAHEAKTVRDGAARTCAHGIDEALTDSGIKNRPWWKKAWDVVKTPFTSWDNFVKFCGQVALVVGIIALFVSGPAGWVLAAVAMGASAVVLGDTLRRFSRGQASLGEVAFAGLGVIPGGKGLATAGKGLGVTARAVRTGNGARTIFGSLRRGATLARQGGRDLATALPHGIDTASAARGPLQRAEFFAKGAWCRLNGRDPVDMASGQMILTQTDVELPGVLGWALRRTYQSGYTAGRWFGAGWSSTLDLRLEVDDEGVAYTAEDGVVLAFEHPRPGGPAVLPASGPRVELALDDAGGYTILDGAAGLVLRFAVPAAGQRGVALPLAAIADRGGNTVEFGYDADGGLAQVSHSGGYQLDVETRDQRVTALSTVPVGAEPAVELVRFRYDGAGRLGGVVNSSGAALRFEYDAEGRMTRWLDRNGTEYRYTYDDAGRVVRTSGSAGILDGTIEYDEARRVTRETNSLGHITEHHFTENLRPLRQIDPLGRVTSFGWDRFDNRTAVTDPLGRTVRYAYDDAGNLVEVIRPDGARATASWNEQRRPVTTVDADGARWEREYDDRGNLTAVVDPAGARTALRYDGRGRLVAVTDPHGRLTQVETDAAGLPITVIDPLGAATSYDRDALGRIVTATDPIGGATRYTWTPEGLLSSRTLPGGGTDRYRYDPEGNLVEHVDAAGLRTRTEPTHFDLPAARVGPDGARLTFGYDTELRLTSVTNPQGLVWSYEYDAAGQLTVETDFDGRTTRYRHDAAGQLVERTNGAGETVTFTRDPLGNVVAKHGPNGTTTFTYDRAGRVVRAAGPDAEVTFERDAAGRVLAEVIDGRRVTSAYDALGRRARRTTPSGAVSEWEYDDAGRPLTLRTAGRVLRFGHDAAGREFERVVESGPGAGFDERGGEWAGEWAGVTLLQSWDADHQLLSQTVTAGLISLPRGIGSTTGEASTGGAAAPAGSAAALAGRRPGAARLLQRRDFSYSADGYVTEIDDLVGGLRRFDLDPMRRVVAVTGAGWDERYAYDAAGNLADASWPTPGEPAQPAQPDDRGSRDYGGTLIRRAGAVRYEHDAQGRVTLRQRRSLSGRPSTWRYSWDAEDRLTTVTTPDGTVWRYRYDPFGRRIAKQRLDATGAVAEQVTFAWDGTVLAEQHHTAGPGVATAAGAAEKLAAAEGPSAAQDPSAAKGPGTAGAPGAQPKGSTADARSEVTTWNWQPDTFRPLTQTTRRAADDADPHAGTGADAEQAWFDAEFHAIVTDLVGTPTDLIAPDTGELAWHARTTLWGVAAPPGPGEVTCPLRFPGQYHDPESTLNYNYHRHYDPTTARYVTADPLGLAPAPNPQAYVTNPLGWLDPLGLSPCEELARNAARRDAMRRFGLPTGQQPISQLRTTAGYQYVYEHTTAGGVNRIVTVTEQTTDRVAGHGPHWEVGFGKDPAEYGRDPLGRLRVHNGKIKVDFN